MCFEFFDSVLSKTFLILKRMERDIINVSMSSCKVPTIVARY